MSVRIEMFKGGLLARFKEYDPALKKKIERIPGGRFVSPAKGGPGWKFHLDMQSAALLKERLGDEVEFDPEVIAWGREQKETELQMKSLRSLADPTDDFDWAFLKEYSPELYKNMRSYQRVGAQFVAEGQNLLIADEPGLGKTWEVIAGLVISGATEGPNLVICPKISIESVWLMELDRFVQEPIFVAPEGRAQRRKLLQEVALCQEEEIPFWLVVNPQMVALRKTRKGNGEHDHVSGASLEKQFPFLFDIEWFSIIVDESQDSGVANPSSQLARALKQMSSSRRIAMSGTPMGGKPLRLWGTLNWLEPKTFSSKIRWADTWVKKMTFENRDGREITTYGKIQNEREEQFYEAHAQYILRRKKEDVFSELPPKQPVNIWVEMSSKQHKQYELMEQESVANIMEEEERIGRVNVPNVLAVDSWLKQFANAYCELHERAREWDDELDEEIIKYRAVPTRDSPKLSAVMDIVTQVGADDPESGEQVIVFTQFRAMADMVTEYLREKGVSTAKITGGVNKRGERQKIQKDFQEGGVYQAIVMTTKSGGVSINLDQANTVIFVDETWNPDDQDQASDRAHRASRIHRVTVYTVRTKDTIEHEVFKKIKEKKNINDILLDRYRRMKEELE